MKTNSFELKMVKTFQVDGALIVKGASSTKSNSALVAVNDVDLRFNTAVDDGHAIAQWLHDNVPSGTIAEMFYFLDRLGHAMRVRVEDDE